MEENKKQEEPKKLTYEELNKAASDLHMQYQKLMAEYQKAVAALNDKQFEMTSYILSMMFKVMDHPNRYPEKFVDWCAQNIQASLSTFVDSMRQQEAAAQPEKQEKKDEA